jgi:hypothetical protein
MINYNKMTMKQDGNGYSVYRAKCGQQGTPTDMAGCARYFYVPFYAKAVFRGAKTECLEYIAKNSGELIAA